MDCLHATLAGSLQQPTGEGSLYLCGGAEREDRIPAQLPSLRHRGRPRPCPVDHACRESGAKLQRDTASAQPGGLPAMRGADSEEPRPLQAAGNALRRHEPEPVRGELAGAAF